MRLFMHENPGRLSIIECDVVRKIATIAYRPEALQPK